MAPSLFSISSVALACAGGVFANRYHLADTYDVTHNFFDKFNFMTHKDYNNGYVKYLSQEDAEKQGIAAYEDGEVYLGVDHKRIVKAGDVGRSSFRIESKTTFKHGLLIARFTHLPDNSCGSWPAFWTLGDLEWPNGGEVNMLEGWNMDKSNKPVIHVGPESKYGRCMIEGSNSTASIRSFNCDNQYENKQKNQYKFQGCGASDSKAPFADPKGGIYAMEWTSDFIKLYSWRTGSEPANVGQDSPDTSTWGMPSMFLKNENCDIDRHFTNQRIILDIAFCGNPVAQDVFWGQGCKAKTKEAVCADYVGKNPADFKDTYFRIKDIRYFQDSSKSTFSDSKSIESSATENGTTTDALTSPAEDSKLYEETATGNGTTNAPYAPEEDSKLVEESDAVNGKTDAPYAPEEDSKLDEEPAAANGTAYPPQAPMKDQKLGDQPALANKLELDEESLQGNATHSYQATPVDDSEPNKDAAAEDENAIADDMPVPSMTPDSSLSASSNKLNMSSQEADMSSSEADQSIDTELAPSDEMPEVETVTPNGPLSTKYENRPAGSSGWMMATNSEPMVASTVYSSCVVTVTSCPTTVTNCPNKVRVVTKMIPIYVYVCPASQVKNHNSGTDEHHDVGLPITPGSLQHYPEEESSNTDTEEPEEPLAPVTKKPQVENPDEEPVVPEPKKPLVANHDEESDLTNTNEDQSNYQGEPEEPLAPVTKKPQVENPDEAPVVPEPKKPQVENYDEESDLTNTNEDQSNYQGEPEEPLAPEPKKPQVANHYEESDLTNTNEDQSNYQGEPEEPLAPEPKKPQVENPDEEPVFPNPKEPGVPAEPVLPEPERTISTIYSTSVQTIKGCPSSVSNCPDRDNVQFVTSIVPSSTTICPVNTEQTPIVPAQSPINPEPEIPEQTPEPETAEPEISNQHIPETEETPEPYTPRPTGPETSEQHIPETEETPEPYTPRPAEPETSEQHIPETYETPEPYTPTPAEPETSEQHIPETEETPEPYTPRPAEPETSEQHIPETYETPEPYTPSPETSEQHIPETEETPEPYTPSPETPEQGTSESETTEQIIPESGTPEPETSEQFIPEAGTPEPETSEQFIPEAGTPQAETSEQIIPEAGTPEPEAPPPQMGISTVYKTSVQTISGCPATVTDCPNGNQIVTKTIPWRTTICPIEPGQTPPVPPQEPTPLPYESTNTIEEEPPTAPYPFKEPFSPPFQQPPSGANEPLPPNDQSNTIDENQPYYPEGGTTSNMPLPPPNDPSNTIEEEPPTEKPPSSPYGVPAYTTKEPSNTIEEEPPRNLPEQPEASVDSKIIWNDEPSQCTTGATVTETITSVFTVPGPLVTQYVSVCPGCK
ncbi:hypothetical protein DCS_04539 [Drechmeria coniospora]|uniref:GH16 domain-containing protein n=1 Tax=Drechmeria coniospora TaxID=98403 RepID=A0A151GKB0_DRECN|nr:hypothetical protein DCS_04539 [Drechmeria coniospora]KYK57529.1 hypothetical protein DCS_04539 [Drechmeria coniospora]